ncbi:hypothetical protein DFH07DRAFT_769911 [Mycena maculata]|uniref:Uncharacterized protein n=1 Tax=Mycena maculata TaxID=230809 RepID=A0AAD7NLT0_9AGAR|nr:hypothetical protein DFH07DRAFT_769911 [Mycena maculata]
MELVEEANWVGDKDEAELEELLEELLVLLKCEELADEEAGVMELLLVCVADEDTELVEEANGDEGDAELLKEAECVEDEARKMSSRLKLKRSWLNCLNVK